MYFCALCTFVTTCPHFCSFSVYVRYFSLIVYSSVLPILTLRVRPRSVTFFVLRFAFSTIHRSRRAASLFAFVYYTERKPKNKKWGWPETIFRRSSASVYYTECKPKNKKRGWPETVFCHSSASVYYTECKPKNKKRGWPETVFRRSSASVYYTERKPKDKKRGGGWE